MSATPRLPGLANYPWSPLKRKNVVGTRESIVARGPLHRNDRPHEPACVIEGAMSPDVVEMLISFYQTVICHRPHCERNINAAT